MRELAEEIGLAVEPEALEDRPYRWWSVAEIAGSAEGSVPAGFAGCSPTC